MRGGLGKPPFGLSHRQEESQTQTAFPPKNPPDPPSPPLPSTCKTSVWSIKRQVETAPLFFLLVIYLFF